jgi:multisubunit Na+/H+ antiporter MnhG subunit
LFAALAILIVNMIWPPFFKPIARLWIGLSFLLGTMMSKILLTVVFVLIVTPVGVVRKWLGADAMQLKKWKKDTSSVFSVRRKIYQPGDLEKPY